jgi:hypothetical protein
MRWFRARQRALLLGVIASMLAAQPVARAFGRGAEPGDGLLRGDLQPAICAAHASMGPAEDGRPPPAPEQKKPLCPWCGLSAAAGGTLSALTAISVSVLRPPRQLPAAVPPIAREPLLRRLQWAACSPHAPPSALSA